MKNIRVSILKIVLISVVCTLFIFNIISLSKISELKSMISNNRQEISILRSNIDSIGKEQIQSKSNDIILKKLYCTIDNIDEDYIKARVTFEGELIEAEKGAEIFLLLRDKRGIKSNTENEAWKSIPLNYDENLNIKQNGEIEIYDCNYEAKIIYKSKNKTMQQELKNINFDDYVIYNNIDSVKGDVCIIDEKINTNIKIVNKYGGRDEYKIKNIGLSYVVNDGERKYYETIYADGKWKEDSDRYGKYFGVDFKNKFYEEEEFTEILSCTVIPRRITDENSKVQVEVSISYFSDDGTHCNGMSVHFNNYEDVKTNIVREKYRKTLIH